jgi:hypothetical protein
LNVLVCESHLPRQELEVAMRLPKSRLLLAVLAALALPFAGGAQEETSPVIVQALVQNGGTSLRLRPGKIYIYGLVTGGARPTSQFAKGQYVKAVDSAGQLAAALAYGTNDSNSYDTQTGYHAIGGLSVAGSWDAFDVFWGSNQQSGASFATVNFTVPRDSLVLVIALASSQQSISLAGVPGLHVDALNRGDGTEAMIIAHAHLPAGTYSAREISAATSAGQDPENMVDLIGVFVLGSKQGRSDAAVPAESQGAPTDIGTDRSSEGNGRPAVTSQRQCLGTGDAKVRNNTHGTIQIMSGTGVFTHVGSENKVVKVLAGNPLSGTVTLQVLNNGPGFAVAPLIQAQSWGTPPTSWKQIANLGAGESVLTAQINDRAPLENGTYYIMFAFQLEMNGANVASGTNWARRQDIWDDGNEIARFDTSQIEEAQRFGCTVDPWLMEEGFQEFYVPADAITIQVGPQSSQEGSRNLGDNANESPGTLNSPATVSANPPAQSLNQPLIKSVSPIIPHRFQTIVIAGTNFGAAPQTQILVDGSVDTLDCNTSTPSLAVRDKGIGKRSWAAGRKTCNNFAEIGIQLISWTDTQIVLGGFGSALGGNVGDAKYLMDAGDPIEIVVTVPHHGTDAVYETSVVSYAHLHAQRRTGSWGTGCDYWPCWQTKSLQHNGDGSAMQTQTAGYAKRGIREVDFLNFDYPSDCWKQFEGFGKVIHVSKGEWKNENVGYFAIGKQASEWMVSYGDLKGVSQDEAVIVTSCQGSVNFDYEEIFVFALSSAGPELLARLSPSDWGPGTRIHDVHVSKQKLIVRFLTGGSHACPDTLVTAKFQWNGQQFVRALSEREPYHCNYANSPWKTALAG